MNRTALHVTGALGAVAITLVGLAGIALLAAPRPSVRPLVVLPRVVVSATVPDDAVPAAREDQATVVAAGAPRPGASAVRRSRRRALPPIAHRRRPVPPSPNDRHTERARAPALLATSDSRWRKDSRGSTRKNTAAS